MAIANDLAAIAQLQVQLAAINTRMAQGIKDIRENGRSITFDLDALGLERLRIEAQLRALTDGPRTVRHLLVTSTKGL